MYSYEYVTVIPKKGFLKSKFTQHREIIEQYANRGYRFVGFVPKEIEGYGFITKIELIFEKPRNL